MKIMYSLLIVMLLAGCTSSAIEPTFVYTPHPLSTLTNTPIPTATESPTPTAVIPTATITALAVAPVSASPLTLTELNAGTDMKRLNVIGLGAAHDIKFSPDGKRLAIATGRGVYLYDGTTFEPNGFIDVNDSVSAIAFSPDGNILAVGVNGNVGLWNVISGQSMLDLKGGMIFVSKLVYGHGGFVAAIGGDCRGCGSAVEAMILWDTKTGLQIFSQHDIWYWTEALAFKSDGKQLFFGGKGGINVIESASGKQVNVYNSSPFDFIFNNDETQLFVTSFEDSNKILDVATKAQQPFALCVAYMTNTNNIGACPTDTQISIFDLSTGQQLQAVDIGITTSNINAMFTLSPNGKFLVYCDKSVLNVVDIQTRQIIKTLDFIDFDNVSAGIVDIDGAEKYVAALTTSSGQVSVFDLQTGLEIRRLQTDCCEITGFAFAPDHKTVATIDTTTLRLWDLQSQQVIYEYNVESGYYGSVAFSPDGTKIYFPNKNNEIQEFNVQTSEIKNLWESHLRNKDYHFNNLGNLIRLDYEQDAQGYYSPIFTDTTTKQEIILPYRAIADAQFLEAFAFSPDNKFIAFGNGNGIFVWDAKTQKQIWHFDQHEQRAGDGWIGAIAGLEFSPQSNLLVSVGWDGTTRLWSISTGNELRVLNVYCSASFTPDGRYLVTAGDGVIRVWGTQQ